MTEQPGPSTGLRAGPVARAALALTDWTERWVPDAFIFALIATVLVIAAALAATPATLPETVDAWGRGFWDLIPFTLQMALVIITGHVLATSPPMGRLIRAIASWPRTPRGAVALVTFFALASSWFNWGFSLVFSAVLALEIARRVEGVDYRALAAASLLGLGSIWAQGLSGSAALQMATPGALQPQIRDIVAHGGLVAGGLIPVPPHDLPLAELRGGRDRDRRRRRGDVARHTARRRGQDRATTSASTSRERQNCRTSNVENSDSRPTARALAAPDRARRRARRRRICVRYFAQAAEPLNALNLNILNLAFLLLGFLLHGTPARLMRAVQEATPAVWGVILQFPFYAGIAGVITTTHLNEQRRRPVRAASRRRRRFRRWSRSTRRCSACSCRRADRSG